MQVSDFTPGRAASFVINHPESTARRPVKAVRKAASEANMPGTV